MNSPLLQIEHLKKYFKTSAGMLHAVDDVSFTIMKGKTLGVVGESGCGKSTLGRTILGLTNATDGKIIFDGENVTHVKGKRLRELCQKRQIIFQDPYSSLDPRKSVFSLIADPLETFKIYRNKEDLSQRVWELMDTVGLARRFTYAFPHELDGGRRQRIGIARALALNPNFIVCDEPVSALDVSIQAQILNLLQDLQQAYGLTYMFITHDLSVVKHISDEIIVMYVGNVVERCDAKRLFKNPVHPYTKGLLAAIPIPSINVAPQKVVLRGELTSPVNPAPGCRFAKRCSYATEICHSTIPELKIVEDGHYVACHHSESI